MSSDARPDIEEVAKVLYELNKGKAPMSWDQLKEGAILMQGRQSYYRNTVAAVYAAMDRVPQ